MKKRKRGIVGWLLTVFVIALLLCGVLSIIVKLENKKANSTVYSGLENLDIYPEIEVPEGVPVIEWKSGEEDEPIEELNKREQEFYGQIDEAIRSLKPQICVVSAVPLDLSTLGESYGYPYFWMDSIRYTSQALGRLDGKVVSFCFYFFTYTDDADRRDAMQLQIDDAMEEYLSLIPSNADDWEACRIVHDEMTRRITYDQTKSRTHCHDIYGALVENSAVCQGYAYGFSYVMKTWRDRNSNDKMSTNYNPFMAIVSEDHAWNSGNGEGSDGYLDVTWDDIDETDIYGNPYIIYHYFGLTKSEMETIDHHVATGMNGQYECEMESGTYAPFNYYKHEGYYLTDYDLKDVALIFSRQYYSGKNVLTLRFENQSDYKRAVDWKDNNADELYDVLSQIGFSGRYALLTMDEGRIVSVLLDYPEK